MQLLNSNANIAALNLSSRTVRTVVLIEKTEGEDRRNFAELEETVERSQRRSKWKQEQKERNEESSVKSHGRVAQLFPLPNGLSFFLASSYLIKSHRNGKSARIERVFPLCVCVCNLKRTKEKKKEKRFGFLLAVRPKRILRGYIYLVSSYRSYADCGIAEARRDIFSRTSSRRTV